MSNDPDHTTQAPHREDHPQHEPALDSTAQKPPNIDAGPRTTQPAENADRHQDAPTPGALSPEGTAGTEIGERYLSAAGIPAVYQTARFAWRETGLIKGAQALLKVNQKTGFDCQSCAWPSPDHDRQVAEFCESGAKAVTDEGTTKRVGADFFREYSIEDLLGRTDFWLGQQGRITHPMVKWERASHYQPISWEEAFLLIGRELNALGTPDAAAFYTSGRTSNEAAFMYQLFARQFGTNNLPDCSNMCHEASGEALSEQIGVGKGCVKLEDFEQTDAIFIIGQNPGTNHPRMLTSLEHAKLAGAKIISINPLPETGNFHFKNPQDLKNPVRGARMLFGHGYSLSDLWLPVRINGDLATMRGIMKEMLEEEDRLPGSVFDLAFIAEYTVGIEEFIAGLRATGWEEILASSGLTRAQIRAAAEIAMKAKRIICCWAMGLTQHKNSVETIQEVMNFLLLGGNIGKPGAGPCPVRGHSNVQGDRTMGIWERMNDQFMMKLGEEFAFTPPQKHGLDTVETIKHMHAGAVRVFIGMGGNFLVATPDTEYTTHAMQQCRLTVQVSTKLNRAHLITGEIALILPALGRLEIDRQATGEQFVTVEDSMGIINPSRGVLEPGGPQLKSEPAIVAGIARATLGEKTTVDWEALAGDYGKVRDHIEKVVAGFERYNERIAKDIFYLPNEARDKRKFNNGTGKAKFIGHEIPRHELPPGRYIMMSIRSHDQFNTHLYGLDDRYRGIYNGRRVVFMNAEDVREAGLMQGQPVDLTSYFGAAGEEEQRVARNFLVAPYEIPRGCTATYYPETNVLVPINSVGNRSNTPTSKFVIISIAPAKDPAAAAKEIVAGRADRTS